MIHYVIDFSARISVTIFAVLKLDISADLKILVEQTLMNMNYDNAALACVRTAN